MGERPHVLEKLKGFSVLNYTFHHPITRIAPFQLCHGIPTLYDTEDRGFQNNIGKSIKC